MYQGMDDDLRDKLASRRYSIGRYSTVLKEMDAEELTLRRKDLGLTQEQLGSCLGVARNTIARWENEKMTFLPLLVDLALESLESNRKKYIKKLERDIKRDRKRLAKEKANAEAYEAYAKENGTGETGEPEPEYDSSAFQSWVTSRPVDTNESDETTGASDNVE
jgi:transcriptional regulator with XRE-family HTH domain